MFLERATDPASALREILEDMLNVRLLEAGSCTSFARRLSLVPWRGRGRTLEGAATS